MNTTTTSRFYGLGLAPQLLELLDRRHFHTPTPIQEKTIPLALEGKDLIGIAQTGTGKTLAFGLPMIQNIARTKTRGLVIVPTRELASQVDEVLQQFGRAIGLVTVVVVGGASEVHQRRALQRGPHIIIATPGRLIDHLSSNQKLLDNIGIVALDEADRMLDMGFAPQIEKILAKVPKQRQTMLFSATMPETIMALVNRHMRLPLRVEIARPGTPVRAIDQEVIFLGAQDKRAMLQKLLGKYPGSVLVFCRTKWGAKKLANTIRDMGHTASEIHSNRTLAQRKQALAGFKSGQHRILVATDIAARGIDVNNIELVINFDLPSTPDDYVHRIGRTARAGKHGKAISFATPDEQRDIRDIERLIRIQLPVGEGSMNPVSVSTPTRHESNPSHRTERHRAFGSSRNRSGSSRRRNHRRAGYRQNRYGRR